MIRLLKNWIFSQLNKRYGFSFRQVVDEIIFDKPFKLIKGTMSSEPDYDDAWSLALALRSEIVFDVGANVGKSAILFFVQLQLRKLFSLIQIHRPLALQQKIYS
jgi:hypothetical protein